MLLFTNHNDLIPRMEFEQRFVGRDPVYFACPDLRDQLPNHHDIAY